MHTLERRLSNWSSHQHEKGKWKFTWYSLQRLNSIQFLLRSFRTSPHNSARTKSGCVARNQRNATTKSRLPSMIRVRWTTTTPKRWHYKPFRWYHKPSHCSRAVGLVWCRSVNHHKSCSTTPINSMDPNWWMHCHSRRIRAESPNCWSSFVWRRPAETTAAAQTTDCSRICCWFSAMVATYSAKANRKWRMRSNWQDCSVSLSSM